MGAEGTSALGVGLKQVRVRVTKPLRRRAEGTSALGVERKQVRESDKPTEEES